MSLVLNEYQQAAANVGPGLAAVCGVPGCLAEDTILRYLRGKRSSGRYITIKDFYKKFNGERIKRYQWGDLSIPTYLQSRTENGEVRYNQVVGAVDSGLKKCVQIISENGSHLTCTPNHRFMLPDGDFVRAGRLRVGDFVLRLGTMKPVSNGGRKEYAKRRTTTVKYHPYGCLKIKEGKYPYKELSLSRLIVEAAMNGLPLKEYLYALKHDLPEARGFIFLKSDLEVHHKNGDHRDDRLENYEILSKEDHARLHGAYENFHIDWTREERIAAILNMGKLHTYDIAMAAPDHNFAANDFIVHNSGKTRTLEARVARLVKQGYPAQAILCMTFTKAAAAEMGTRLSNHHGIIAVKTTTIHALCHEILAEFLPGYNDLKVDSSGYTEEQELSKIVVELRKKNILGEGVRLGEFLRYVSTCKNSGPTFVAGNQFGLNEVGRTWMRKVSTSMAKRSKHSETSFFRVAFELELNRTARSRVSYDDMINWAWSLLVSNLQIRQHLVNRWGVLIMDEAQDSTALQWDVAHLLAGLPSGILENVPRVENAHCGNLMIAGDIAQSCYAWRNAVPEIMLEFCTRKDVGLYQLPVNYRSTDQICKVSSDLVRGHPWHLSGDMKPARGIPGEDIKFLEAPTITEEARKIVQQVQQLAETQGGSFAGIAVLSRLSRFLGLVEVECIRLGIPYVKRASSGLFETREINDLLAYLRVAGGYDTEGTWGRKIVNVPFRYIGRPALDEAGIIMKRKGGNSFLSCLMLVDTLSQRQQRSLWALKRLLEELSTMIRSGSMRPGQIMEHVIHEVDYLAYLAESRNDIGVDEGLLSIIYEVVRIANEFATIPEFLKYFDSMGQGVKLHRKSLQAKEGDGPNRDDLLVLSTIHRSKGLEYQHVFIGDVNVDRFPCSFAHSMDEERRLLYVACSRAKDTLTICSAIEEERSPFLIELMEHCGIPLKSDSDPNSEDFPSTADVKTVRRLSGNSLTDDLVF